MESRALWRVSKSSDKNWDCPLPMQRISLSTPGEIGGLTLKNRVVMAPMISNLCNQDGSTGENHIAYLEARAKGGAALVITEYTCIDRVNSRGSRNQMGMYSDDLVPRLRRLTERVHRHGAHIFTQLVHAGGKALGGGEREPFAPSAVDYMGRTPTEMTAEDIDSVVAGFASASGRAMLANFDGVELHGAHGYLIQEFLSPALNRRTDRYGGSMEGRLRFAQEVIDAVREEVDGVLGIRLSLYEDDAGGYGPEYGLAVAEALRGVDYVHFSAGRFAPPGSSISFYGARTHIAARLPRRPSVRSMVVGSVTSREEAEAVLEKADFVAVGRGMLADPSFAAKVTGEAGPLRPCIRCNQACRDISFGEVRCTVNPETGPEAVTRSVPAAEGSVHIAGAGVKGMEAAIAAAKAGLSVTIHDIRDGIGGQLLDITDLPKKAEFSRLIEYYREELDRLGVKVELGSRYEGKGLYCLPDREYPPLPMGWGLCVDSCIYRHHDDALQAAAGGSVLMTEGSLRSLDRARAAAYMKMAEEAGVRFGQPEGTPDVSIMEGRQYDLLAAMVSGREAAERYLEGLPSGTG